MHHLELKEHPETGVYVKDLSKHVACNADELNTIMTKGNKNRVTGATNMNEHSSRSHAIFSIRVERQELGPDGKTHFREGKLNLVDLAGSERQSKTGAQGTRLKEATKINLSLWIPFTEITCEGVLGELMWIVESRALGGQYSSFRELGCR